MWRFKKQAASGLAALLLVGMAACVDLEVLNPNDPDAERALSTAGDVESLIAGAYDQWLYTQSYSGPMMMMSNAAGQHAAPWANAGMEMYARIPRIPTNNIAGADNVANLTTAWYFSYRAIAAVRDGLKAIEDGQVTFDAADEARLRAFGRYMQGLAHANVAILYDSGFVYDESIDPETVTLVGASEVFAAAAQYFADAIALSNGATFTIPSLWMSTNVPAATLVRLAYSQRAKYRAAMARTPAERAAVDWTAVVSDANNGVQADWAHHSDCYLYILCEEGLRYAIRPGWSMANNWVLGMADQSGNYQTWINTPTINKQPFIIITPDTRLPQGADYAAQLADSTAAHHFNILNPTSAMWKRDDRGTWRWSYYHHTDVHGRPFYSAQFGSRVADIAQVTVHEMQALIAEAAFYSGNLTAVANYVNATRTTHGLNATDAAGTNTSCVPKLPNGSCGNLWEMFKWETRWEDVWVGPYRIGFYFNARGWGDLMEGTILQFPVPYGEMQILLQNPYNFGGVNGQYGAPVGTYGY